MLWYDGGAWSVKAATDTDSTNEIQQLSVDNAKLVLSRGNSIDLSHLQVPELPDTSGSRGFVLMVTTNGVAWVKPGNSGGQDLDEQNLADVLTQGNDAGAKKITNLAEPTDSSDAATKRYIDRKIPNGLEIIKNHENSRNLNCIVIFWHFLRQRAGSSRRTRV